MQISRASTKNTNESFNEQPPLDLDPIQANQTSGV